MRTFNIRKKQINQNAFMMPAVILIMSVMMIIGSAALLQASNILNISIGLGRTSTARSAARAGVEYAQVAFSNTSCWVGTGVTAGDTSTGGNGPITLINEATDRERVEFVVIPDGSPDPCTASDVNVTVEGRVYSPRTSTGAPKKVSRVRTILSKYTSLGAGLELAGGGDYRAISGAYRVSTGGKELLFGVYGNVDKGNHFVCIDLKKSNSGPDSQYCDGVNNQKESTWVPSDNSDELGEGANNFMTVGSAGNIGSKPFLDENPGEAGIYRRFYFAVHSLGPNPNPVAGDDKMGYGCIEVTIAGVIRPCTNNGGSFKQVESGPSASPNWETIHPNQMFDGPIEYNRKLYGLAGVPRSGQPGRKMYCYDLNTQGLCAGQPYTSRLPDFLAAEHRFVTNNGDRYGMYATSAREPGSGSRVYWAINYSAYSTLEYLVNWGTDGCTTFPWCVRQGSQRNVGTRVDCFDMATNAPCPMAASSVLDGGDPLPGSNATIHSVVYQPFFMKDSAGAATGFCASVTRNPYYMRPTGLAPFIADDGTNTREPLRCWSPTTGAEITDAVTAKFNLKTGLEGGLAGSYNMGISYDDRDEFGVGNRTYFVYTAFNHPIGDFDPPFGRADLPQPKRNRSLGMCWDWSKPNGGGRCDSWSSNKVWSNAPPAGNMNVNLGVGGYSSDGKCLIAITTNQSGAGLFAVNPATGDETCNPFAPRRVF